MPNTETNWKDPNYVTSYLNDLVRRREAVAGGQGDPTGRQTSPGQIDKEYQRVYGATQGQTKPSWLGTMGQQSVGASAPSAATYSPYQPKTYATLTPQQALTQARSEIDPTTRIMEQRTNKMFRDQRSVLPQLLNARGQASGGLRDTKEQQMTQDQAMNLNEITMQQDSAARQLARQLQSRSEDVALQKDAQDFQRWATSAGLDMQQAQAAFSRWAEIQGIDETKAQNAFTRGMQEKQFDLQERQGAAGITGLDPLTGLPTLAAQGQLANISLAKRGQEWQEIVDAAKLGQTDKQITLAENSQDFNQWAAKQGISQDWKRLSIQEKKENVDRWATLRGIDLQQQGVDLRVDEFETTQQAKSSTSRAISDVLTAPSKSEAYDLLNASIMNGDFTGADLTQVTKAIENRWESGLLNMP